MVCPMQSAWDLAAVWSGARLVVVPASGHAADEPGIASALVEATEAFKTSATP
jgi:proline iminopeptidase